jgi:hypothetical protein
MQWELMISRELTEMPWNLYCWPSRSNCMVNSLKSMRLGPVIAQFVARSKGLKDRGQTGETRTFPTHCHLNGEVLSI